MNGIAIPRISYCLCGDQAFFLDVDMDRYYTLPASQNRDFIDSLSNKAGTFQSASVLTRRLVDYSEPCRAISPPIDSSPPDVRLRANPVDVARAAVAYGVTVFQLKRCGLAHVLRLSANRRALREPAALEQSFQRLAAAFNTLAPICGRAENCLPRSIAFHALAIADGHTPSLVIGAKRDPFAAHAWVQDGTRVLNDSAEHVRIFTPILVI